MARRFRSARSPVWVPGDTPEMPLSRRFSVSVSRQRRADPPCALQENVECTSAEAMSDRSAVGLYFSRSAAAPALGALTIAPPSGAEPAARATDQGSSNGTGAPRASFTRTIDEDLLALSLYPHSALANANVNVRAERPDGSRVDLIRFRPQPDWTRRYWFKDPVALPKGTRVTAEVTSRRGAVAARRGGAGAGQASRRLRPAIDPERRRPSALTSSPIACDQRHGRTQNRSARREFFCVFSLRSRRPRRLA